MSETRTYRGGSLEELLPRIRAELGDDAVVVRQREGLTGGVAGFFQKRTVEIEARRGEVAPTSTVEWFAGDPEEEAIVTLSPRFTTVHDEAPIDEPAPVAITPEEEQAAREFAAVTAQAPPAPAGPPPAADPAPRHSAFSAYLNAAGAPEPAPSPAPNGIPEGVPSARAGDAFPNAEELIRDAVAAKAATNAESIVTSPQVDAIPVPEPPAQPQVQAPPPPRPQLAPEPDPEPIAPEPPPPAPTPIRQPAPEPIHEPPPAASAWDPPQAPPPVAAAPPEPPPAIPAARAMQSPIVAQVAVARPQAARHLAATLTTRGVEPSLAATIVDDALLHRLPLEPVSTLPDAVAAQLAARIPVATLSGPAARTLVLAGAAGSGAPRLVAGIAGAYASRTAVEVACIALRTPDGGRALAAALAPLGVPVHAAADGTEAARQVALLGGEALVLIDTPPVTTEDAGRLASDLGALGPHELHLALGPGGGPSAAGLMQILRPHRLALGDPSDPLHLGAVLQAAIDSACPITFVASTAAAGRPDLAVHPADAGALARALTA